MPSPVVSRGSLVVAALCLLIAAAGSRAAHGTDQPLAPADTSSPRATLESFVETVDRCTTICCTARHRPTSEADSGGGSLP
jgi:hypothetical protein